MGNKEKTATKKTTTQACGFLEQNSPDHILPLTLTKLADGFGPRIALPVLLLTGFTPKTRVPRSTHGGWIQRSSMQLLIEVFKVSCRQPTAASLGRVHKLPQLSGDVKLTACIPETGIVTEKPVVG